VKSGLANPRKGIFFLKIYHLFVRWRSRLPTEKEERNTKREREREKEAGKEKEEEEEKPTQR
jgi:hypothetical protein